MNWKWGTAFGIMVLITLVSIVYAFVQQTVANASRIEAEHQFQLASTFREESEKQKKEAEVNVARAQASEVEARRQQQLAEDLRGQLDKCRGKK